MRAPDVFTLVLLASGAAASPRPQQSWDGQPVNATTTTPPPNAAPSEHGEISETDFELDSIFPSTSTGAPFLIIESTVTGWETGPPTTHDLFVNRPTATPSNGIVITTQTPIVVTIVTDISNPDSRPSQTPNSPPSAPPPPPPHGDQQQSSAGGGGQSSSPGSPGGGGGTTVPALPQSTAGGGELLSEIISHIAPAPPTAQPITPPPADPTPTDGNPSPTPTVAANNQITVSDKVLTLTPGLSTTVDSTVVVITTNSPGQTIVVISSSGTAISATVTQSVVTITTTRGPDATSTSESRSRNNRLPGEEGAATSTSSKAEGISSKSWETEWVMGMLAAMGFLM